MSYFVRCSRPLVFLSLIAAPCVVSAQHQITSSNGIMVQGDSPLESARTIANLPEAPAPSPRKFVPNAADLEMMLPPEVTAAPDSDIQSPIVIGETSTTASRERV